MPTIEVYIEEAFYDYLVTQTSYTIYSQHLPQRNQTFPAVVYTKAQGGREYDLISKIDIKHPVFTLDVFGESYVSVVDASNALKELLNGYSGSWRGLAISNVIVRNIADLPPERINGRDQLVFHQAITLEIWYVTA